MTTGVIGVTIMSASPAMKAGALALAVAGVVIINVFRSRINSDKAILTSAFLVVLALLFDGQPFDYSGGDSRQTKLPYPLTAALSAPEQVIKRQTIIIAKGDQDEGCKENSR